MVNIKPLLGPQAPDALHPLEEKKIDTIKEVKLVSSDQEEDYIKKHNEKPEGHKAKKSLLAKALERLNIISR